MNIRTLLLAILVCASLPAAADFRTVKRAIEVTLSDLQVPVTPSGSLIFKECDTCESRIIPMTRNTQFRVNGKDVGLKEFRKNVLAVRDRDSETIVVLHDLETNTITSVSVRI